jgi:Uma2 family endonuclease
MSAIPNQNPRYTVVDLYRPEFDGSRIELWEGELHEKMPPATYLHNQVIMNLLLMFHDFIARTPGLRILPPGTGCLFEDDTVLIPDLGLHRSPPPIDARGLLQGAPELAVEVVSPSNSAAELARKRRLYFAAGAEQVWIVYPEEKFIEVYPREGQYRVVADGVLEGDGVVAGLMINVSGVFNVAV